MQAHYGSPLARITHQLLYELSYLSILISSLDVSHASNTAARFALLGPIFDNGKAPELYLASIHQHKLFRSIPQFFGSDW